MKMVFPRFFGDEPIEWLDRVVQFFAYQQLAKEQKVTLAAFYLEGEANQLWQWIPKVYWTDGQSVTWEIFVNELLARFGPTEYENFDEVLSHIIQRGTLRDYQKEYK